MASVNIGVSAASIFLAYLPLPHPPKLTGADAFQLLEHAAEVVQLSNAAFQTDFFYTFVRKPQHSFRMGDPHLLQVSDQRHTKAVRKIPNRVTTQASSWIDFIEFSQYFYLPFLVPDPNVLNTIFNP